MTEDRRYLVLAPMPVELRSVTRTLRLNAAGDGTHRGRVGSAEVVAALAGIGPAAATKAARRHIADLDPVHVIVTGVAGGVRPDLAVGSLLVPERVAMAADRAEDRVEHRAHPLGDAVLAGGLITTTDLIVDPAVHAAHLAAGFDAVDMETAAIAAECEAAGRPWTAFRGISDHVDEGLLADPAILSLLDADGGARPGRAAALVLRRPSVLRTFAKLASGTRAATTAASRATRAALETS